MKTVLITGATAGIGRACAELLAGNGWLVTAVARSATDLQALTEAYPKGRIKPVAADLSTDEGLAAVPIPAHPFDAVILNAANFRPGGLLDADEDIFTDDWALNVRANHLLARAQVPGMVADRRGQLVVIGSTGTDDWPVGMTAYVATKYALRGLYEGWSRELAGSGVVVTLVSPGATLTRSWAGTTDLPPDILAPETVAGRVLELLSGGTGGRHVIR